MLEQQLLIAPEGKPSFECSQRALLLLIVDEREREAVKALKPGESAALAGAYVTAACYKLRCDGERGCTSPVTHIDAKGWIYCASHGEWFRGSRPCRKLRPHELRRLERGEAIKRY